MKLNIKFMSAIVVAFFFLAASGPHAAASASRPADIPMAARVVLSKAVELINKKAYDKAARVLSDFQKRGKPSKAGESDPKGRRHPEVYFALGTCRLMTGDYRRAAAAFEAAVKKDPAHVSAWLNLARAYHEQNDYQQAARCFEKAYANGSDKNPEHLYYAAAAHLMADNVGGALTLFETLFKNHASAVQPAWRENYIHALLTAGQARKALPHIRHLAETYAGDKQVQWQEILLHQYLELNMQKNAREYALFLSRHAPEKAKWWKALAHVELRSGRHEQALVPLIVYSYLTPLTDQEKKLLADLHLQLGVPAEAAPLYEALLRGKQDDRLLQNLALALQQTGRLEQALERLDRFAPDTKHPALLALRADLLYGLKKFEAAADAYRKAALADNKKAGRAWLMAGYAAMQAKDVTTSRRAFEKAASYDGHRKAALLAMRQLPES